MFHSKSHSHAVLQEELFLGEQPSQMFIPGDISKFSTVWKQCTDNQRKCLKRSASLGASVERKESIVLSKNRWQLCKMSLTQNINWNLLFLQHCLSYYISPTFSMLISDSRILFPFHLSLGYHHIRNEETGKMICSQHFQLPFVAVLYEN